MPRAGSVDTYGRYPPLPGARTLHGDDGPVFNTSFASFRFVAVVPCYVRDLLGTGREEMFAVGGPLHSQRSIVGGTSLVGTGICGLGFEGLLERPGVLGWGGISVGLSKLGTCMRGGL